MTIDQIYNSAIEEGIKADPRGRARISALLRKEKEQYRKLPKEEKEDFDKERLNNPFSDTRILFQGKHKKDRHGIKKILTGIDIGTSEVLLAKELGADLIISHHPLGSALANLDDAMHLQADLLANYGIPINVAESLLESRVSEVSRAISPLNHFKSIDAAKALNIPIICIHTPADNLCYQFLKKNIEEKSPETVNDLIKLLKKIPEYRNAAKLGVGPKIFAGKGERRCGKIAITEVTGGTEGSKHIYEKMSQAGIGTVVGMHMAEEHRSEAEKHHLNVVIAGHISSDSLGLNLLFGKIVRSRTQVISCSGYIKTKR